MRTVCVIAALLAFGSGAFAQTIVPTPNAVTMPPADVLLPPPPGSVRLTMTLDQATILVQTLGQIGCQTVQQLTLCEQARDLLRDIQRQVREQAK